MIIQSNKNLSLNLRQFVKKSILKLLTTNKTFKQNVWGFCQQTKPSNKMFETSVNKQKLQTKCLGLLSTNKTFKQNVWDFRQLSKASNNNYSLKK